VALLQAASVDTVHAGLWAMAGILTLGGLICAVGIVNPASVKQPEVEARASLRSPPNEPVTGA
jgi:uncharacterized membrane protein